MAKLDVGATSLAGIAGSTCALRIGVEMSPYICRGLFLELPSGHLKLIIMPYMYVQH